MKPVALRVCARMLNVKEDGDRMSAASCQTEAMC